SRSLPQTRSLSRVRALADQRVPASKELVSAAHHTSVWVATLGIPRQISGLGSKPCVECRSGAKGCRCRPRARRWLGCTARPLGILGNERQDAQGAQGVPAEGPARLASLLLDYGHWWGSRGSMVSREEKAASKSCQRGQGVASVFRRAQTSSI